MSSTKNQQSNEDSKRQILAAAGRALKQIESLERVTGFDKASKVHEAVRTELLDLRVGDDEEALGITGSLRAVSTCLRGAAAGTYSCSVATVRRDFLCWETIMKLASADAQDTADFISSLKSVTMAHFLVLSRIKDLDPQDGLELIQNADAERLTVAELSTRLPVRPRAPKKAPGRPRNLISLKIDRSLLDGRGAFNADALGNFSAPDLRIFLAKCEGAQKQLILLRDACLSRLAESAADEGTIAVP